MKGQERTALLGWGSLIWDSRPEFDEWHEDWTMDGPQLPVEFSRISASRDGALTLVIDEESGSPVEVAWCVSKRSRLIDAVGDLRCREGTTDANIGRLIVPAEDEASDLNPVERKIATWARSKPLDCVVWTSLPSNFEKTKKQAFSVLRAIKHLQELDPAAKVKAAEYVWRAPSFVQTPLRHALEVAPWFAMDDPEERE